MKFSVCKRISARRHIVHAQNALILLCVFVLCLDVQAEELLAGLNRELHRLIDSSKVSVVTITSGFSHEVDLEQESGILSFFKTERQKQSISYVNVGSGLLLDSRGYVLTRSSIVFESNFNNVTLSNGKELPASFVGHDPETGFAVIKIDSSDLAAPKFAEVEEIRVGSWVMMIGNTLGAFPAVDFGAINSLRRDGLIQISANLNPGNNGSPIFSMKGEVIGMVVGRINASERSISSLDDVLHSEATLVYPIGWVKRIAEDIIELGYVRKGWLGVVGYDADWKAKIREIRAGSPAKQAGLSEGDVILNYSGNEVNSISELVHLVEYTTPGHTVWLDFMRANELMRVEVEIGERAQPSRYAPTSYSEEMTLRRPLSTNVQVPGVQLDLVESNRRLEKRVEYLEKELLELKKTLESRPRQ